jgi:hypothetical protein
MKQNETNWNTMQLEMEKVKREKAKLQVKQSETK